MESTLSITSAQVRHDPERRRFINALGDGRVIFKLQCAYGLVQNAGLIWRAGATEQEQTLEHLGNVNGNDFFGATVPAQQPLEYVFRLQAANRAHWFTPRGVQLDSSKPEAWFRYEPGVSEPFATPDWVRDAVFYQIFSERFCNGDPGNDPVGVEPWGSAPAYRNFMGGDLQGVLDKVDYLADLGITALYMTPVFKSASNHKYDTIDYFSVDEHFGDMELLRRLVDACHARGIRVILDAVFNHCSHLHPFFLDVKEKGRDSRYWNWFYIKKWPIPDKFARRMDSLEWYECWWGFHELPKLNYANPEVEEYFLNVAQYWLHEAKTDGWRLDVPNEVIQTFWPKFRRAVKQANPQAYIVGEIWEDATSWLGGDQFDAVMNYRFQKALLGYFAEEKIDTKTLDHTLRQIMLDYPEQTTAVMLNLLGSHDTARPMTVALSGTGVSTVSAVQSLKLMAALQFTFEGAPCIYYGDEIGMEGAKDPDCRRCYPWGWEQKAESRELRAELLAYYTKLIAIRKANPALRVGTFRPFIVDNDRGLYAFERRSDGNHCIIALNRSKTEHTVQLPRVVNAAEQLSGRKISGDRLTVPARSAAILTVTTFVPVAAA